MLVALIFILSGGSPIEKLQGRYLASFTDGQELTKTDFINNQCRIAEQEQLTIRCDVLGNEMQMQQAYNKDTPTSFRVELEGAHITGFSVPSGTEGSVVVRTTTNSVVCQGTSCIGQTLIRGQTYSIKVENLFCLANCNGNMIYYGRPLSLFLSAPQVGIDNVPIPSSTNCIKQDITSGTPFDTLVKIDKNVDRSIALTGINDARNYPRGAYRELANIVPNYYNDKPAMCDFQNQRVTGFTGHTSLTGQCYAIPDSSILYVDGRSQANFCCSNAQCQSVYGLSSDYNCVNYFCKKETSNQQCITIGDCDQLHYITNQDGTTTERKPTSCSSGVCIYSDRKIACNPSLTYSNNQCCKYNPTTGSYGLENCIGGLLSCDTLGANACCTNQQSQYTIKLAPLGKMCCQTTTIGIGVIVNNEEECQALAGQCTTEGKEPTALKPCCGALVEKDDLCSIPGVQQDSWIMWFLAIAIIILILIIIYVVI